MKLTIRKEMVQKMREGYMSFHPFGIREEMWKDRYGDQSYDLDMTKLSADELTKLREMLERHQNVRGVNVLLNDMKLWSEALHTGARELKARTVRQFETILQQYMLRAPRQHLYQRLDENAVLCYYVNEVTYHPPRVISGGDKSPPIVVMTLMWTEFGQSRSKTVTFYDTDCRNIPVDEALLEKGYAIENPTLRADYDKHHARWEEIHHQIGKQYLAEGFGREADRDSWRTPSQLQLDRFGEKSRVVVDVFDESGKETKAEYRAPNRYYWKNVREVESYNPETDEDNSPAAEWNTLDMPEIEVPVHPWLIVFHLQKHIRIQAHVAQLEEYIYDSRLSEKLILPEEQKELVKLLIETKGGAFQDIVSGKGGGAVILLCGQPGTGKTLTAEVYAESEQRPLYSVQCSQLGTNPDNLEKALMMVFDRARRWNAVMLLDEADVYVRERGGSLQQNAIVGVFLRVLEYQGSTLFLTTNRPEDVDDAIASRCIARIAYKAPTAAVAAKIWRVLADNSNLLMSDASIDTVTKLNPEMTGRDIKNILKLASLRTVVDQGTPEITPELVRYVQQFKPTGTAV